MFAPPPPSADSQRTIHTTTTTASMNNNTITGVTSVTTPRTDATLRAAAQKLTHTPPHRAQFNINSFSSSSSFTNKRRLLSTTFDDEDENSSRNRTTIFNSLISPTAAGEGDTLTATSPNTIQAFQSIAELASPTTATSEQSRRDPLRMVAAAAAAAALPTNSTTESITETVKILTPDELASKMTRPRPFLLLDCRSALTYNTLHIIGAANINCADKASRKRLQQQAFGRTPSSSVGDLISSKEARALYRKRIMRDLIIYDDFTSDLRQLPPSDALVLVVNALLVEDKDVSLLSGGFNAFHSRYGHLCDQSSSPSSTIMMAGGDLSNIGRRRRQLHFPSLFSLDAASPSSSGGGSASVPPTPSIADIGDFDAAENDDNDDAERAEVSQIMRGLFLGNERDAANFIRLQQLKITHVVNITTHIPCHHQQQAGMVYLRLPASDSPRQDLLQHFAEAFEFIDKARSNDHNVLVHCQAGISRSATITVSYLMRACGLSMQEAYKLVKQKRPVISPNLNFMGQLFEYEKTLTSASTTAAPAAAAALPPSSPSTLSPSTTTSSRPTTAKQQQSASVVKSLFEKKSSVSSPRAATAAAAAAEEKSFLIPTPSSTNTNKRPGGDDHHHYPLRALKRPVSLRLTDMTDLAATTKSAPQSLQNESDEAQEQRVFNAFGFSISPSTKIAPTTTTIAEENSENIVKRSDMLESTATTTTTSSPNHSSGNGGKQTKRSPLTPTNNYPTLVFVVPPPPPVVGISTNTAVSSASVATTLTSQQQPNIVNLLGKSNMDQNQQK